MAVNHLIVHYLKLRRTLDRLENGGWRADRTMSKLTIGQVEHIKGVVEELEKLGIKDMVPDVQYAKATN